MKETIRVRHTKEFSIIANAAIRDCRLSFKSRGLHHLLLSYPDGWEISIKYLTSQSEVDGETAIRSALQELELTGYLTRTQVREKGKIVGYESVIRELPIENPEPPKGRRGKAKNKTPQEKPQVENLEILAQNLGGSKTPKAGRGKATTEKTQGEPQTEKPQVDFPQVEKPQVENRDHKKDYIEEISNSRKRKTPLTPRRSGGEVEEQKPAEKCSDGLNAEGSALEQINSPGQQNPESLARTDDLSLGQICPATLAPTETTASRVRRTWQETGILPSEPLEFEAWVQEDLGKEIIALYRKSGRIATTKRGDINPSFAKYVAAQWPGKDIDYGYAKIRKMEREPQQWEILASMVVKWQTSIYTGNQEVNLVQEIGKQEKQGPPAVNFGGRRI